MLIKICGITNEADAETAVAAGADLLGFVFRQGTPRALVPAEAGWIREIRGAETVGVFVDAPLPEIIGIREELGLDWVQLHGDEPDAYLGVLGRRVIRRVGCEGAIDWNRAAGLAQKCLPLFDPGAGDGRTWAWEGLAEAPPDLRFGLAGGLSPTNVAAAIRVAKPYLVDVSSGVEAAPGIKDPEKVRRFVDAGRRANHGDVLP